MSQQQSLDSLPEQGMSRSKGELVRRAEVRKVHSIPNVSGTKSYKRTKQTLINHQNIRWAARLKLFQAQIA